MTHEDPMTKWINELAEYLGVDKIEDPKALLDITREVAHNISRPAAPLTLFLMGQAMGPEGQGPHEIVARVNALIKQHKELNPSNESD